ncbi:MAG: gephyrin-like molybdotransferase Glp [Desulfuromonadales bacterium]
MPIPFAEARRLILEHVRILGVERLPLLAAAGRVLAEEVVAPCDLPHCDISAMDGYAVRTADCRPGTLLEVTGFIPAGGRPQPAVTAGCAVKIMTGAPVPAGCDAVAPVEETEERPGSVRILQPVSPRRHIRYRGEDVAEGDVVIPAGALIRPPEISMLASLGRVMLPIRRRPRVAIVSTGDELVEPGETRQAGQIVNSNAFSLAAAVQECGGEPALLGIARDDRESHRQLLGAGLDYDVLITSAGVSVGDRDLVREILAELGVRQVFWKAAIQPGRPIAFGVRDNVPVFSLPGNPVATLITFEMFVRPALLHMQGHAGVVRPTIKARLCEPAKKKPGRVRFLRVQVRASESGLVASTAGDQNTGILRTMVRANGIGILPAEAQQFAAGDEIDVHLLDPIWTLREGA